MSAPPLLAIDDLAVTFNSAGGPSEVLSGVTLSMAPGEVLGLVGESGSGKSVTALATMGLLGPQGVIKRGAIRLAGQDLVGAPPAALTALRGRQMSMIFQEPMTSLNPLLTVGFQISEVLVEKLGLKRSEARSRAITLMERAGIPAAERRYGDYPHTLSGGLRQRAMIAIAMACAPQLLIADEPTTALDVTIQAQILELMLELRDTLGMGVLLITHDMGVIARIADRVAVMYAGEIVEEATVGDMFTRPAHPYTRLLMAAIPSTRRKVATLPVIPGAMPVPGAMPSGCRFHPRCPLAVAQCSSRPQALCEIGDGRMSRCWRAAELLGEAA